MNPRLGKKLIQGKEKKYKRTHQLWSNHTSPTSMIANLTKTYRKKIK
jgi:hypothetical protein